MTEQPGGDREWEHWPGRGQGDDGIRHRLRGLFASTDDTAEIEALIAERGRELEQRTSQLTSTIADLERREERARQLRGAVEEMLRSGSAELDVRQAELSAFADELARRSDALAETERELELRRQELGAVELRRAALERRELALEQRIAEVEQVRAQLDTRLSTAAEADARVRELDALETELAGRATQLQHGLDEVVAARQALTAAQASLVERERKVSEHEARDREERPVSAVVEAVHLVFVAGDRYRLEERAGAAPGAGQRVMLEDGIYEVVRVSPSPLPGDDRRCAFLVPVTAASVA